MKFDPNCAAGRLRRWAVGFVLGLGVGLLPVHAGVVDFSTSAIEGGVRSGHVGGSVSLSFSETNLNALQVATLTFSFESSVLSFQGATGVGANGYASPISIGALGGRDSYSLWVLPDNDVSGDALLFTLFFDILSSAVPGTTTQVEFTNDVSATDFSAGGYDTFYDREAISGTITILADTPGGNVLPVVGTPALTLLALALALMAPVLRCELPRRRRLLRAA